MPESLISGISTTIRRPTTAMHFHLKLALKDLKLQYEYAFRNNSPEIGGDFKDTGLYAQLSYDLKKWTFAGRYDWYDLNDTVSNDDQFRYTAAINYHFAHNVIGKVEYNINEFDDPLDRGFQ